MPIIIAIDYCIPPRHYRCLSCHRGCVNPSWVEVSSRFRKRSCCDFTRVTSHHAGSPSTVHVDPGRHFMPLFGRVIKATNENSCRKDPHVEWLPLIAVEKTSAAVFFRRVRRNPSELADGCLANNQNLRGKKSCTCTCSI
jgi:hypothetical protein